MQHALTTNGDCQTGRTPRRRPRVLVSAYSCCPNWGSEPGVGWKRVTEIAKYCDTWVLTEKNDAGPLICDYLKQNGPIQNLEFVFVERRPWERMLEGKPVFNHIAYRRWLRRAFGVARQLHAEIGFDIAHQLTFTGFREPSYLYRLGIPFVWGPTGGAQNYPGRFLPGASWSGAAFEVFRTVFNTIQLRCSRTVRQAAQSAAAIFAANSETKRKFQQALGVDPILMSDAGTYAATYEASRSRSEADELRILWAGRLETWKALELLIEALALLPKDTRYALRVIGQGPRRRQWQRLAQRRGISANIRWMGHLPHDQALELFHWADVFAFTSLRDTTGTVVLEAISAGKPVICLDHQGVGDIVTPECGIKIPVTNRRDVERRLSDAIVFLQRNLGEYHALCLGTKWRATYHHWSVQARRIVEEYNRILVSIGSDARCALDARTESEHKSWRAAPIEVATPRVASVTT